MYYTSCLEFLKLWHTCTCTCALHVTKQQGRHLIPFPPGDIHVIFLNRIEKIGGGGGGGPPPPPPPPPHTPPPTPTHTHTHTHTHTPPQSPISQLEYTVGRRTPPSLSDFTLLWALLHGQCILVTTYMYSITLDGINTSLTFTDKILFTNPVLPNIYTHREHNPLATETQTVFSGL